MARKKLRDFISIVRDIDALSEVEQKELASKLLYILSSKETVRSLGREDISKFADDALVCPYCGSVHVVKKGFSDDGITRRYKCVDCKRSFRRTTNSVVSNTRKSPEVWEQFILLTLKGASLETCSIRCKISIATAFAWRHKIMAAMVREQADCKMSGIVEMDETFVSISYKGNHKHSKTFTMPRPAYKRGSDNKEYIKACVLCAIERGNQAYGEVICRGNITTKLLENVLPKHIEDSSIVITDGLHAYGKYFRTAPQVHVSIKSKVRKKGVYHINHINNFHARLKAFLRSYNGVSTKYLNNYVGMFVWLENARIAARSQEESAVTTVLEYGSYKPAKAFAGWERLPALAPVA